MNAPVPPDIYRVVTDMEALHEAFRDRVEDMDVSRLELDAAAGFTPGYASKLLCDPPIKYIGKNSLAKMLKGTGLAIALVVNDGKLPKAERRKYKIGRIRMAEPAASEVKQKQQEIPEIPKELSKVAQEQTRSLTRMQELGFMGGIASGKKRRAKAMRKRELQRKRAHAARLRWAKPK